jgi:hypothetical protein
MLETENDWHNHCSVDMSFMFHRYHRDLSFVEGDQWEEEDRVERSGRAILLKRELMNARIVSQYTVLPIHQCLSSIFFSIRKR